MKKVILIGDSITLSYRGKVKSYLENKAEVSYPAENARWSGFTYNSLRHWMPGLPEHPDVIHWNNGIWDCAHLYEDNAPFSSIEVYLHYIRKTYELLKSTGATVIFATSTPPWKNQRVHDEDIVAYNKAAVDMLKAEGCIIDDLYSVVAKDLENYIIDGDGVHLTDDGINECAKTVSQLIEKYL